VSGRPKYRKRFEDPQGTRYGMPTFGWHTAPEGTATRRQLRTLGLQPARQRPVGQIMWPRPRGRVGIALLYDIGRARPKKPPTEGQLRAVDAMLRARSTCPSCGTLYPFCLPRRFGGQCWPCAEGSPA
jgi:hypothetical protein